MVREQHNDVVSCSLAARAHEVQSWCWTHWFRHAQLCAAVTQSVGMWCHAHHTEVSALRSELLSLALPTAPIFACSVASLCRFAGYHAPGLLSLRCGTLGFHTCCPIAAVESCDDAG